MLLLQRDLSDISSFTTGRSNALQTRVKRETKRTRFRLDLDYTAFLKCMVLWLHADLQNYTHYKLIISLKKFRIIL